MTTFRNYAAAVAVAGMLAGCGQPDRSEAEEDQVAGEARTETLRITREAHDNPAPVASPSFIRPAPDERPSSISEPAQSVDDPAAVTTIMPARGDIDIFNEVRARARALAAEDYEAPPQAPAFVRDLNYNDYRRIEFRRDAARFTEDTQAFRVMLDTRGSLFRSGIDVNVVSEGSVTEDVYNSADFNFHDLELTEDQQAQLGLAGFRLLSPINQSGRYDEVLSVKGASFFRALGAGNFYGASARGIAVNTAAAEGEEFPDFREFWMRRPAAGDQEFVFYALMDGPSVTGVYEFHVRPGVQTRMDINAVIYAREETRQIGIAPLTSMFEFGPQDPETVTTDFRPRVHDSEGLLAYLRNGEWIWRPLNNPATLQISSFTDEVPSGFGLIQRTRDFHDYQDIEARYENRPSVWVTPGAGWVAGELVLVEIPTPNEYNDNVINYWRLDEPLLPGESMEFSYTLSWGMDPPYHSPLASVRSTRTGAVEGNDARRLFIVDYDMDDVEAMESLEPVVSASAGTIHNVNATPDERNGIMRLSFELQPPASGAVELRALLQQVEHPASETWLYRWSPS